ncbi:TIGR04283 family arsenosugar biosynthesis glycosyltransferase [Flavimarina sp. Hel_I_48]|uniref:TIGR04283 family arsenosugar biosynthesis glycosyltransferase n=1 Tax=Flavimarina sp. Hel_I_48 TaxID=1392488 RepID=UPI000565FCD5|nr:TIGR04283 family arsenosugar biosynthesis glycosyltransferase [Flavimarina sp. Hel_I_48]
MLSIIVPVLNEAGTIKILLDHLITHCNPANISEIIMVDGGSEDDTIEQVAYAANRYTDVAIRVISSAKGRAKQMNAGAAIAVGNVLYFLHADSFPPAYFDRFIVETVKNDNSAGCFCMRFDSKHWWLRLVSWFTQFDWRACRGGDQSLFITKVLFEEIGGYDETYIIYEDNILIDELYARNTFTVIPHWLTTSARLYERKGVWHVQYHFLKIYFKKWQGADANELYAYYNAQIRQNGKPEDQKSARTTKPITEHSRY